MGTCFVISPIGDTGSSVRASSDLFLNVVKDAAEPFQLDVIRADELAGPSDINVDIIQLIQDSELCIIDLTNLNPNVMYEFGMRCQAGRPYIVCASKGTKLPFDMVTKRTLFYDDLQQYNNVRELRDAIRRIITIFQTNDYQAASTITLEKIYTLLQEVDEKIDRQYSGTSIKEAPVLQTNLPESVDILLHELGPAGAFYYAYKTNNVALAETTIDYCKDLPNYQNKLCALASMGSPKGTAQILDILTTQGDALSMEDANALIGSATSGMIKNDGAMTDKMLHIIDLWKDKVKKNKDRAMLLNQKERIFANNEDWNHALSVAEEVIRYDDTEPSYFYNYAMILMKLNRNSEACEQIKKALEESTDADHLMLAYHLLSNSEDVSDKVLANEVYAKLKLVSPYKAKLIKVGDFF